MEWLRRLFRHKHNPVRIKDLRETRLGFVGKTSTGFREGVWWTTCHSCKKYILVVPNRNARKVQWIFDSIEELPDNFYPRSSEEQAMTKYTSGMLCRDKLHICDRKDEIAFFPLPELKLSNVGIWRDIGKPIDGGVKVWTSEEWKAQYGLTPPKPGKCFEVDIEL